MIGSSLDILLWLPRAWFAYTTLNGTGVMGASNCVSVRIVAHPEVGGKPRCMRLVPQSLFPQTEHCRTLPTCIVA
jgi:hypothetical protein